MALAQTATNKSSSDDEALPYSVGIFGGVQAWKLQQNTATPNTLAPGGVVGIRATQDFYRYFGFGEDWTVYGVNNLRFVTVPGGPASTVGLGGRNGQVFIGPMLYLTPPESKFRPFFTVGPAFQYFWPTQRAKEFGSQPGNGYLDAPHLQARNGEALVFGGGARYTVTEKWSVRLDVHGIYTGNPDFNLSGIAGGPGSIVVKPGGTQLGVEATLGVDFHFGHKEKPEAPPLPPPPPPPPGPKTAELSLSANPSSVCPGESVRVTASGAPAGGKYQWSVNGEPLSSAESLDFGTAGRPAGSYNIGLTVNAEGYNPATASTSVTVRAYGTPTGSVTASPSSINAGDRSTLSASFSDECHGAIQPASYSASEGTVSGNIYDSSSVQFDPGNNAEQRKTVTITATATGPGGTGTATTTITVTKAANRTANRLPDIVFGRNNARVNNCGKRVLLEELKTYLDRDPTGKVVLVGHIDKGESKAMRLDRKRALNAAAIISAGKGICLNFAPSQIMIVDAGEEQGGVDFQPYFCGTSTNVKERSGQEVSANDKRAQYRRVEVWFVPTNGVMPPSASNAKDAASMNVGSLGCPK